jgi:hypothetical protein
MSDGTPMSEDTLKPKVFGYQIVHKITGRILPTTTRTEIYSKAAAIRKMNKVTSQFNVMECTLDIWDYELSPIYDHDKPTAYNYIIDKDDYLYE